MNSDVEQYLRRIDTYDESKGRLFTWMLNIARNAAIDKTRRRLVETADPHCSPLVRSVNQASSGAKNSLMPWALIWRSPVKASSASGHGFDWPSFNMASKRRPTSLFP